MEARQSFNTLGSIAAIAAVVLVEMLGSSLCLRAQDNYNAGLVQQGYAIAPVPLNLAGRDYNQVGLGSYLVNAVGDCNGCHSSGAPPLFLYPYATGGNPYFGQKEKIDPAVYLNGGAFFGQPVARVAASSRPEVVDFTDRQSLPTQWNAIEAVPVSFDADLPLASPENR